MGGYRKVSRRENISKIIESVPVSEDELRSKLLKIAQDPYNRSCSNSTFTTLGWITALTTHKWSEFKEIILSSVLDDSRRFLREECKPWGIKVLSLLLSKPEGTITYLFTQEDFYISLHNCYERLLAEFKQYGKIIIAVDFDDTLHDFHKTGKTFTNLVNLLNFLRPYSYIIINSSREEADYDYISNYLASLGLEFDKINENAPFAPFKTKKVYANIYVDDRGGLPTTYKMLCMLRDHILKQEIEKVRR